MAHKPHPVYTADLLAQISASCLIRPPQQSGKTKVKSLGELEKLLTCITRPWRMSCHRLAQAAQKFQVMRSGWGE